MVYNFTIVSTEYADKSHTWSQISERTLTTIVQ